MERREKVLNAEAKLWITARTPNAGCGRSTIEGPQQRKNLEFESPRSLESLPEKKKEVGKYLGNSLHRGFGDYLYWAPRLRGSGAWFSRRTPTPAAWDEPRYWAPAPWEVRLDALKSPPDACLFAWGTDGVDWFASGGSSCIQGDQSRWDGDLDGGQKSRN